MSKRAANRYTAEAIVKLLGLPPDAVITGAMFYASTNTVVVHFASESAPETPEAVASIETTIDSWSVNDG